MVMFLAGIIGFFATVWLFYYSIVLGIILGRLASKLCSRHADGALYYCSYLSRPICSLLILAGVLTLSVGVYQALRAPREMPIRLPVRKGKSTTS